MLILYAMRFHQFPMRIIAITSGTHLRDTQVFDGWDFMTYEPTVSAERRKKMRANLVDQAVAP
jgi:hypothetical protein